MTTGERMKNRRKEINVSVDDVAKALNVSIATIYRYENGDIEKVPGSVLEPLAKVLRTTPAYLMGWDNTERSFPSNILPMPNTYKVPLLGDIACGDPILAVENIEGEVDVPEHIRADFALRCKGDSMINARIFDGDIVYIRQQRTVENGQIAAVRMDESATLKRVKRYDDHIVLEPANPMYEPLVFWHEKMNEVDIIGKAVGFTSLVR